MRSEVHGATALWHYGVPAVQSSPAGIRRNLTDAVDGAAVAHPFSARPAR